MTLFAFGNLFGCAGYDKLAALVSGIRAEVDDPVCGSYHVKVVFDNEHRMAGIDQALEHLEQHAHVIEVQAGGGFVEKKQRRRRRKETLTFLKVC